ncbi:MAG TPA: hypothetical protein VLL25_09125, partial [Acidimicrobiales bacterium]|nr:hypothetical protein [Acidimicrobiales bacterium]
SEMPNERIPRIECMFELLIGFFFNVEHRCESVEPPGPEANIPWLAQRDFVIRVGRRVVILALVAGALARWRNRMLAANARHYPTEVTHR